MYYMLASELKRQKKLELCQTNAALLVFFLKKKFTYQIKCLVIRFCICCKKKFQSKASMLQKRETRLQNTNIARHKIFSGRGAPEDEKNRPAEE